MSHQGGKMPTTLEAAVKPSDVLRKALEILGEDGRNWGRHCATTATYDAMQMLTGRYPTGLDEEPWDNPALDFFCKAAGINRRGNERTPIWQWNDHKYRSWPQVKEAFEEAIALSENSHA